MIDRFQIVPVAGSNPVAFSTTDDGKFWVGEVISDDAGILHADWRYELEQPPEEPIEDDVELPVMSKRMRVLLRGEGSLDELVKDVMEHMDEPVAADVALAVLSELLKLRKRVIELGGAPPAVVPMVPPPAPPATPAGAPA